MHNLLFKIRPCVYTLPRAAIWALKYSVLLENSACSGESKILMNKVECSQTVRNRNKAVASLSHCGLLAFFILCWWLYLNLKFQKSPLNYQKQIHILYSHWRQFFAMCPDKNDKHCYSIFTLNTQNMRKRPRDHLENLVFSILSSQRRERYRE